MKGEWKPAFEPWHEENNPIPDQIIRWAMEIKSCPKCAALVGPGGTLTHELECWK